MNTTRRTFLQTSALLAASLPFARPAGAQTPAPAAGGGHPRGLFFDASDLPRIRANLEQPRFAEIRRQVYDLDHTAARRFLRDELRLNDHVTDFARARSLLEHAALAHALRGDAESLETARLALGRIVEYPRWDYFLEGGRQVIGLQRAPEGTIAVCCALDWIGDKLPADLVAQAERDLGTKGAPACYTTLYGMKYPDRVRGWSFHPEQSIPMTIDFRRWPIILNATNLKIIPTAALGIVAVWLMDRHPEVRKWLEMSRQSAQAFSIMYGSDGSYDEGVGYWGYTTMHLAMLAEVLHRRLGIDDRKLIDYSGSVRFALQMASPTAGDLVVDPNEKAAYNAVPKGSLEPKHDLVNFGDGGTAIDVSVAAWVARVAQDPLAQHIARETGVLKHYHAAFWYQPELPATPPTAALHDVRLSNDWVISRTGWAAQDTVVAFRSGGPANHEHADRNSVLFKAHGERLFHDPFKAAYVPEHPKWVLRLTEGHTAVLIGGKGHQYHDGSEGTNSSWASARVTAYQTGPGWMTVTSDATEAYQLVNENVVRVERTLVFVKPDVLLLLDRVVLRNPEAVQTRYQVFNDDRRGNATVNGTTFRIERPRATLQASTLGSGPVTARTGRLPTPDTDGIFPFAEVESAAAAEHTLLTTCTAAPSGSDHGTLAVRREGDRWSVTGRHRGVAVNVTLTLTANGQPTVSVG